jgi:phospholipid/cholesterol/gamma-HCH transport system ATP-binding protein
MAVGGGSAVTSPPTEESINSGPPNAPPTVIELAGVSQWFGPQLVLREISLSVLEGETLVIVGESGCGKSVTLKLMMALLEASRGRVMWRGRAVRDRRESDLAKERLRFGFLFQGAALFDSMPVYDNVAFGLRQNTDLSEQRIRAIVHDRIKEVGLQPAVCERKPADLSGGMKKRVALARALAMEPEVMFYDEPTTVLDPVMSDVINQLILRTRDRGHVTSIVVTHDMRTVERVADRVVMLAPVAQVAAGESQILFEGTAEALMASGDPRVDQFVYGKAGERIEELSH